MRVLSKVRLHVSRLDHRVKVKPLLHRAVKGLYCPNSQATPSRTRRRTHEFVLELNLVAVEPTRVAELFRGLVIHLAPFAAKISFACGDTRNLMNPSAVSRCDVFARSTAVYVRVL